MTAHGNNVHDDLTYRERIGGYLHPRDMRRLVTPFSASNEPALIVRRHVMLLNFDPIRAVILRDRLLVLVPHGADSLLSQLERRVRGGSKGAEMSVFGTSSEVESTADEDDDDGDDDKGQNGSPSDRSLQDMRDNIELNEQDAAPNRKEVLCADTWTLGETLHRIGEDGAPLSIAMKRNMEDLKNHKKPLRPFHGKSSDISNNCDDEDGTNAGDVPVANKSSEAGDVNTGDVVSKLATSLQGHWGGGASCKGAAGTAASADNDDTSVNSEWEEMNTRNWIDLPFELQCADAVLSVVCSILSEDAYELQEAALGYIDSVVTGKFRIGDDPLTGLR
jgi:hypothetical protein